MSKRKDSHAVDDAVDIVVRQAALLARGRSLHWFGVQGPNVEHPAEISYQGDCFFVYDGKEYFDFYGDNMYQNAVDFMKTLISEWAEDQKWIMVSMR